MTTRFTILGCGSSGGVPRVGGDWGACDPDNPKNRRRRCALLIERTGSGGTTRVLIDTGPDMREQLLSAGVPRLDAAVYTHPHADHLHGIDDLRGFAMAEKRRVDVYMDDETLARATAAFGYCFEGASGYPPILNAQTIVAGEPFSIDGDGGPVTLTPFNQLHGRIMSLGFRIGDLAYSSDLHDLPAASLPHLEGLDVWILDALRYKAHSSHLNVEQALAWVARMAPGRAVLTNLHQDLDYETLKNETPAHVEPAYDMMVLVP
ncbi:MBL fold metallo-hydrolase [Acuticoccus sp. MNP-M23]|uniref:MBL fold metallo-hydrolase n=1 Tax=Acuticoccus sp. MNP-M23 TaxID=3072793 RepID=UPI0028156E68|nr:MBL fold metallo-hydrolase [Acuticoccus sp. MNP-M23]WMS42188.1 MBL fold metallo-hydrolase [Acuticoccus sp. MNP-M23]